MAELAGRARTLKRAVRTMGRFALTRQRAANVATVAALEVLAREVDVLRLKLEHDRRSAAVALGGLKARLVMATHRQIEQPESIMARLDELERKINGPLPADVGAFYQRFEAVMRPAGPELDERLSVYVPVLTHLVGGSNEVLDVGTGRGDLLAVLARHGIPCRGVDLNPQAAREAAARGLRVAVDDALHHLRSLPDQSVGAVTALHVVEHLEPHALIQLVDEIARVIMPAGTLIVETPNARNVVVGASSFYHDPTHKRPVTPEYLTFLLGDRGFVDIETMFLHPHDDFDHPPELGENVTPAMREVFNEVRTRFKGPQDYAVIARSIRVE